MLIGSNPPIEPEFFEHAFKPQYDLEDYTVLFFEPESELSRKAAEASMDRTWPLVDHGRVLGSQELFQRYSCRHGVS